MKKTFCVAANCQQVWRSLRICGPSMNFAMVLSYIEKFSPWIKEIYINQVDQIEDADDYDDEVHLSDVMNNCFALTSLNIEASKTLDQHFRVHDELAKRIKSITLRNVNSVLENTLANKMGFTTKVFVNIMAKFENLRHLSIVHTSKLKTGNVMRITNSMPLLIYVNVEGTCFLRPDHVIKVMRNCPQIETFLFSPNRLVGNDVSAKCQTLRHWFHMTRMYYPWVKFSTCLTCEINLYLRYIREQKLTANKVACQ